MHRHEPLRAQIFENLDGLIRTHVDVPKGFRMVRADGQQGDLGRTTAANILEAVEIGAVAGVINPAALMFEHETAITAVVVAQDASAPMFAGGEGDAPIPVRKTFPPFQLDDPAKAEVVCQVTYAPRHYPDFGRWQAPQGGFMEMIEMGMGEQQEVNRRQMLDLQPGALDPFEEEEPVGEVGVD